MHSKPLPCRPSGLTIVKPMLVVAMIGVLAALALPGHQDYQERIKQAGHGKGRQLNPLSSDFDLYSVGKDGDSTARLTNKLSLDGVVRANDGAFIGLAADYTHRRKAGP